VAAHQPNNEALGSIPILEDSQKKKKKKELLDLLMCFVFHIEEKFVFILGCV
jgi:hypothetical protein